LPDDESSAVEKVLSTGADDPGMISKSIAMTATWDSLSKLILLSRIL